MTEFAHDPLVALWQTAQRPDLGSLFQHIEHHRLMHRRFGKILVTIIGATSLLLILEEATGRLATHGWLSAAWLSCLGVGLVWRRRARCQRDGILNMDTVSLLKSALKQAKQDLFLARCLYAGVPCGAACGFLFMHFSANHPSIPQTAIEPTIRTIQTVAGVVVLSTMIIAGLALARARRTQVRTLGETLNAIATEV